MEITLEQVKAYCSKQGVRVVVDPQGMLWEGTMHSMAVPLDEHQLHERIGAGVLRSAAPFGVAGYESLATVLVRAYEQAAKGKGKERHAQDGERFEDQMMQDMARRFGVGALLSQAFKKSEESQRLPHDRAVAELLGAIVYTAGAIIAMERKQDEPKAFGGTPAHANDNAKRCCTGVGFQSGAKCTGCAEYNAFGGDASRRA